MTYSVNAGSAAGDTSAISEIVEVPASIVLEEQTFEQCIAEVSPNQLDGPEDFLTPQTEVSDLAQLQQTTVPSTSSLNESIEESIVTDDIDVAEIIDAEEDDQETVVAENESEEEIEDDETSLEEEETEIANLESQEGIMSLDEQIEGTESQQIFSAALGTTQTGSVLSTTISQAGLTGVQSVTPASIFSPISSLGTTSLLGNNLSLLGQQGLVINNLTSPLGDLALNSFEDITEIQETIEDTSIEQDGEVEFSYEDLDTDETESEYTDETESEYTEDTTSDDASEENQENQVSNESIINATINNDTLIGGTGDTEFSYDFDSQVGGTDVLSDIGNTSDDRIFFNNIPNNYAILLTDNTDGKITVETFDETSGVPFSVNTISTDISDGELGIEDYYFGRGTNSDTYLGTDVLSLKSLQNYIGTGYDAIAVKIGTTESDSLNINNLDLSSFNIYSDLGANTYSSKTILSQLAFTKSGDDKLFTSDQVYTLAHLGSGSDEVIQREDHSDGKASLADEGSFFDGGSGYDTITGTINSDHFGFNSSDYGDSPLTANNAILSEQGSASNISDVDYSYFRNFEVVDAWLGDDTYFFGGDPGNDLLAYGYEGDDIYNFNFALTSDIDARAESGDDTFNVNVSPSTGVLDLTGNDGNDIYNFNSNVLSTINANAGSGNDNFNFNSQITGQVEVNSGEGFDTFKFNASSYNTGLTIDDFDNSSDLFEFSSSAFLGSTSHVLVYGKVNGNEFMPDANSIAETGGFAFDSITDTAIPDLLAIDIDYWYYDIDDGSLYYDENSDQFIDDAIFVAKVTNDGTPLTPQSTIKSSDITYSDDGFTI